MDSAQKPVVVGYCFGGAASLEAVRGGLPVAAVCAFHGVRREREGGQAHRVSSMLLLRAPSKTQLDTSSLLAKCEAPTRRHGGF